MTSKPRALPQPPQGQTPQLAGEAPLTQVLLDYHPLSILPSIHAFP